MFFGYPLHATGENWIHDCLLLMVHSAIEAMIAGNSYTPWPNCVPEPYRTQLISRRGLKKRFEAFCKAVRCLDNSTRNQVLDALIAQNNQPAIFDGQSPCPCKDDLPQAVREPAQELFKFAFELLTKLGTRDLHYKIIYDEIPSRVCPFCGCEYFDAPGAPRHDLDHYLPISKYPFAGSNLRNVVPMGDRCNSAFKGQIDTLTDASGQRRRCFDPYGNVYGAVSLLKSRPFEGEKGKPEWDVDLGQSPKSETWDQVWQIKLRYKRDVLDQEFFTWLDHFACWCQRSGKSLTTNSDVIDALDDYIQTVIQEGFADRAFLKRAVFEMLRHKAQAGSYSERLSEFLIDLIPQTE